MRVLRGRGGLRSQGSIKSRLGVPGKKTSEVPIQSRLGKRGGATGRGVSFGTGRTGTATISDSAITDARQKINLNRVLSGRIGDARDKIELKRSKSMQQFDSLSATTVGKSKVRGIRSGDFSPIKTLKITTANPSPGSGGLFRNAVSGMGGSQWAYAPPPVTLSTRSRSNATTTTTAMLTRTIRNPQPKFPPEPPGFTSSYSRMTAFPGGMYSSPAKLGSTGTGGSRYALRSSRAPPRHQDSGDEEEDMDMDDSPPQAPAVLRSSVKSRLDAPSRFKVKVSNLQPSVTTDDIMELFADVGDLISARVITSGLAEAYYRSKADCLKAIEAYHNRLLDGSPMKVVLVEEGGDGSIPSSRPIGLIASLKSAGGATMKIPKSTPNPNIKIHPDISAIHKVLFQPSSSSNSTKMLFNKSA